MSTRAASWALLGGNFVIGCGVMVTAGSLNDLVRSLQVSVALGGQLISSAAAMMAVGAPLLAAAVAGWDRRRLLALTLVWYGVGHALCALMPNYAALLPLRAATVLGAAVFTPQAAAAMAVMVPAAERGRAITFLFLGWSLSSVLGMPLHSYIGEAFGWRWAFALVALLSAGGSMAVWRTLPDGIRPAALSLADWRGTLTHPLLMGVVAVTALSSAGQFTLFSYFAPYYRQVLGADAAGVSGLFLWFGAFGLLGNLVLQRVVDRFGAARCVTAMLGFMAFSLLLWPLAASLPLMALVITPWALGCFSSNSAQQARLGAAAPLLAPALMALNTSAMYLGQAVGAAGGGAWVAARGFAGLQWAALGWMLLAIVLSVLLARRMKQPAHA
jgi:MFS transporter, DHA1 family, inner membrane transport protein